jgi:hypothetical protein
MRTIHDHENDEANRVITIEADDLDPACGNASHHYELRYVDTRSPDSVEQRQMLTFQRGPIRDVGLNGITDEALLAIVIDRLECFQQSPLSCVENAHALICLDEALGYLHARTQAREARGVEGTRGV